MKCSHLPVHLQVFTTLTFNYETIEYLKQSCVASELMLCGAKKNSIRIIDDATKLGAKYDYKTYKVVILAIQHNNLEVVKHLLECKRITSYDYRNYYFLRKAFEWRKLDIFNYLLSHGYNTKVLLHCSAYAWCNNFLKLEHGQELFDLVTKILKNSES
jgi:hypothetical protein